MNNLRLKVAVQVNQTAGTEGSPPLGERLTLTPVVESEDNAKLFKGPRVGSSYQPIIIPLDNPESFGVFQNAQEAYVDITPIYRKAAKAKPVARSAKPPRARQLPAHRKSSRKFVSVKRIKNS
jgi:hypothetical protein